MSARRRRGSVSPAARASRTVAARSATTVLTLVLLWWGSRSLCRASLATCDFVVAGSSPAGPTTQTHEFGLETVVLTRFRSQGGASVQCGVQSGWSWSRAGATWHNLAQPRAALPGRNRGRSRLCGPRPAGSTGPCRGQRTVRNGGGVRVRRARGGALTLAAAREIVPGSVPGGPELQLGVPIRHARYTNGIGWEILGGVGQHDTPTGIQLGVPVRRVSGWLPGRRAAATGPTTVAVALHLRRALLPGLDVQRGLGQVRGLRSRLRARLRSDRAMATRWPPLGPYLRLASRDFRLEGNGWGEEATAMIHRGKQSLRMESLDAQA